MFDSLMDETESEKPEVESVTPDLNLADRR